MKRSQTARPSRSHPLVIRLVSHRSTVEKLQPQGERVQFASARKRPLTLKRLKDKAIYLRQPLLNHSPQRLLDGILDLTLPLPPSINHQYATVQGRRVLSSAGRRFKLEIGQEVLCAIAARRHGRSFMQMLDSQSLVLDLRFYFESGLRRDIDGGLKITQDAVCEALGINDNRIIEVVLRKDTDRVTPRMELSLRIVPS